MRSRDLSGTNVWSLEVACLAPRALSLQPESHLLQTYLAREPFSGHLGLKLQVAGYGGTLLCRCMQRYDMGPRLAQREAKAGKCKYYLISTTADDAEDPLDWVQ